ncbi:MAG: tRNA pseudouridine(38-40) synthase TruA [Alphaproteobacteria bacterium]|nr:tRNA pseudouridine(38-40) synthase TruA [Alphaproteobacteria bacterium]
MSQRYKIVIEYDGTDLLGWQKQLDGPSVQEYLEKAIYGFLQQTTEVYGAGRTDAGVHALAQVAHFDLEFPVDEFRIREAMNAHLRTMEAPVSVLDVEAVSDDFNARFSAKGRSYIYRITNRRAPLVLDKNRSWWVYVPLDVEKMREGAKFLLGNHDFSSFRAAKCQAKSPIKTLDKIDIEQTDENITFYVEARSFLHHQVRNMVGTLKMVGDGHLEPEDVKKILESKDRTKAGPTAPAQGLYLSKIMY